MSFSVASVPRFTYVALDSRGQESSGLIEATSSNEAIGQLRQAGYFPTNVYEEGKGSPRDAKLRKQKAKTPKPAASATTHRKAGIVLFERKTIKPKTLMVFTRQLATLIDAGLPLLRGLTVLQKQERDPVLNKTIGNLSDAVQGGSTFSEGLAQHPRIFNDLYVNMVRAGEVGGVLELVLTRLAEFQEKAQKIKNKVVAAMVYPIIVLVLAIAIMGFLLVFIVPRFEAIFADMLGDRPLPALTRFVIGVSNGVKENWMFILGAVVLAIIGVKLFGRTARGRDRNRSFQIAHTVVWRPAPQDGDLAFLAHARHAGHQRCPDFTGAQHYAGNRWQYRHCRRDHAGARQRQRRRIDRAAARGERRVPAHGRQHDRCRRGDWPVT